MKKLNTQEFIEKAKAVHGDKYDYSPVVYTTAMSKVSIRCREHGDFQQTPNSHLHGSGCPKCGSLQLNTERFIAKAKEVHGDIYDYSQVVYTNNAAKVTIVCPTHGAFQQSASGHMRGNGCPKCAAAAKGEHLRARAAEDFVRAARAVHGDKYDYSKVVYETSHTKVEIVCPKHGGFLQVPNSHLNGSGCPKCGVAHRASKLRSMKAEFVDKARAVHGDKYDYSAVDYYRALTKVEIVCPTHGSFLQTPASHLSGYGCVKCGLDRTIASKRIDTDAFISRVQDVHGDRYDYTKTGFTHSKSKLVVTCKVHGDFVQMANDHQQGKGCPKCATSASQPELDIISIIEAAGYKAEHRYRPAWMQGKELDIYVPALKLAIEYCGSHVHNVDRNVFGAEPKHKQYHYDKWKACRDNGVTLITVYDFLWETNRDKIERMLKHKLQKADRRVYARNCEVVELDRATCWDFVKTNHIEGTGVWKYSCTYKGLTYKGELVAVMVEQDKDIKRSCTLSGTAVVGGVSKLFKQFPKGTTMMTTNDTGSSGDYGIRIKKFTLRYWWVNLRTHEAFTRRACQKHTLESKFGVPVGDMTEVQYMTAQGYVRVFDSGLSYFVNA